MIYSQFQRGLFQRNPVQAKFSGIRGLFVFAIGVAVVTLSLIALPFILLFGALSFIALSLFARVYMKRKMAQFAQTQHSSEFTTEAEPTSAPFERDSFKPRPHQGCTFEHDELN